MITEVCQNWDAILDTLLKIHAAALVIVNLTPTPKDNRIYEMLYRPIEILAGIGSRAKEPGGRTTNVIRPKNVLDSLLRK